MKYFLFNPANQAITGPFELDDIEAKLNAGKLSADTRATGDIGESLRQVRSTPAEDWMPVQSIPGIGQKRATFEPSPVTPPPLPLNYCSPAALIHCPNCGYKLTEPLATGRETTCFHCGETVACVILNPAPPSTTVRVAQAVGGALLVIVGTILGGALILLLLYLVLLSQCRA